MRSFVHYTDAKEMIWRRTNHPLKHCRAQIFVVIPCRLVTILLRRRVTSITAERFMLQWQARSNPLAWWWGSLTLVSAANILVWFMLYRAFYPTPSGSISGGSDIGLMFLLCAGYVFGCA